jgi:hypothetical protein
MLDTRATGLPPLGFKTYDLGAVCRDMKFAGLVSEGFPYGTNDSEDPPALAGCRGVGLSYHGRRRRRRRRRRRVC